MDHRICDSHQEMSPFEYEPEILQRLPHPLRKEVVLYIHRRFPGCRVGCWREPNLVALDENGWSVLMRFTCFVFLSCIDELQHSETNMEPEHHRKLNVIQSNSPVIFLLRGLFCVFLCVASAPFFFATRPGIFWTASFYSLRIHCLRGSSASHEVHELI